MYNQGNKTPSRYHSHNPAKFQKVPSADRPHLISRRPNHRSVSHHPFIYRILQSTLVWWRARRRRVPSTIRRLRALQLNAILLTVVTLICASATVVPVVVIVRGSGVRRCGLVLVVVVWRGGLIVVVGARARGPACAVDGLATGFAAAAGCKAAVGC